MSAATVPNDALCMSVTFLTGRYHGEEWPPSPARLYQALVAALMTCGNREFESIVEPALLWLEEQAPPRIRCCVAERPSAYRIAVPNNDMDVVAWEWQQGRHKDVAVLKTMKQVSPWHLPESGPHVQYVWSGGRNGSAPPVEALRQAAQLLHTLGWGVDMAFADIGSEIGLSEIYQPSASGDRLAAPMPGTLDDLKTAYRRFQARSTGKGVDSFTRPSMLLSQPYTRAGEVRRPVVGFRLMMAQDATKVFTAPWEDCRNVAAWLRHRAAEELENEFPEQLIAEYVQGHNDSADADKSRRVSYVPLPTIYGKYADGLIRRAIIIEPPGESGDVANVIGTKLTGAVLTGPNDKETCCLAPPEPGDWTFRQYLPDNPRSFWRSVTPVVLHGYNTGARGVISVAKTERLLLRAFAMAGFPEELIGSMTFQAGPFWTGSKHAAAMKLPEHLQRFPRLHIEVRFSKPVRGPVLAGIGRHYGIGVFAVAPQGSAK